ncbi:uncharacterized protein LOC9656545 [Selaginella moellendorffii]|uniref:uncharacterized protein LOC9656545 n=1 Tax=Selaginella moellendorffii TaxID=88036 RepID=UPI000D1CF551|nr:uncharacterized protein LOC9656545 [Selaginella moellendorffii]|eukprot:XP_024543370.1 uncharacterized protein LOC9656545 [Selaginella moellendorffii]
MMWPSLVGAGRPCSRSGPTFSRNPSSRVREIPKPHRGHSHGGQPRPQCQPRLSVGLSAAIKSVASLTKTTKVTFCGSRNGAGDETLVTTYGEDELYVVKWRSARSILASRVPARYIHCSHVLLDYFLDDQSVALRFQCGGEVTIIRAKFVVGADGINSAVRRAMYPADRPWDLHLINWNALVHNPGRFSVHDPDQIAITRSGGPSICYLVGAGEDYTLWVFRVEDRSTAKESSGGFCDESGKARVLEEIDKLLGSSPAWEPLKIAVEATEAGQIFQRRIKDRIPLESWSNLDQRWCSWAMLLMRCIGAPPKEQEQPSKTLISFVSFSPPPSRLEIRKISSEQ